jgi:RNA polymerase sigma factor (sigma-70 family)
MTQIMELRRRSVRVDDAELVERMRAGDRTAFTALYRAHAGAVHTAVRDNVHDADSAADVVQETFTRALARLDSLRQPDRFRPWLLSIARHAAVDHRRVASRVGALSDEAAEALPSERDAPDDHAELAELAELLEAGVATLSTRDATALSLVTHLGFGAAEVGAALGVKAGAAKVVVHRARRRLRDAVALQVLVRAQGEGCAAFESLCGDDDLVAAARHVRSCAACGEAASREVGLYDANVVLAGTAS